MTTRLYLAKAAHTWASLQEGNSVSEELTNIQQCPGGGTESMERGESCGKLNWALNTRATAATYTEPHTHKQTDTTL